MHNEGRKKRKKQMVSSIKALEIGAAITSIKNSRLSVKIVINFLMLTCSPAGYFV